MNRDKIIDNFTESKYVRFFVAFLNKTWIYGSLSYTDFNFSILSFDEFLESIKREIGFTFSSKKDTEERSLPFKIFILVHNKLNILDEKNYYKYINYPEAVVFCTQDETIGLECLDSFKESSEGNEFFNDYLAKKF